MTIPAQGHLTLSFGGAPSDRPSSVKVYAYDPDLASQLDAEERERVQAQQERELLRLEEERAAKEKVLAEVAKEREKGRAAGEEGPAKGGQARGKKAPSAGRVPPGKTATESLRSGPTGRGRSGGPRGSPLRPRLADDPNARGEG